jgi:hypothetical protein
MTAMEKEGADDVAEERYEEECPDGGILKPLRHSRTSVDPHIIYTAQNMAGNTQGHANMSEMPCRACKCVTAFVSGADW